MACQSEKSFNGSCRTGDVEWLSLPACRNTKAHGLRRGRLRFRAAAMARLTEIPELCDRTSELPPAK
ncbi:MAG: hypothetical protein ACI382_04990 [Alloprevotella sp.]